MMGSPDGRTPSAPPRCDAPIMSQFPAELPVIDSCDGCGACCRVVVRPPYYRVFEELWEDAWERLRRGRPDLLAALIASEKADQEAGLPDYGRPCQWYDAATARCLHYEYRPLACHEFEVGGEDCRDARRRAGIASPTAK